MNNEFGFVPKILLCGDEADFFSRVGERPFKIIGHAKISDKNFDFVKDGKIFFDGKLQDLPALTKFLQSGAVDYFVFTSLFDFAAFRNNAYKRGWLSSQVVTLDEFKVTPPDFLYDVNADIRLLPYLKNSGVKTLLDVDAYFARGRLFTKFGNDFTEIDAVSEKNLPPITENFYTHIYKNLAQVGLKHYDAALIIEREPAAFESMLALLENFSDVIITFARKGSELERYIFDTADNFKKVLGLRGGAVDWYLLTRQEPPENFCIYVVTHKKVELDTLPEGYEIIHAGREGKEDLGYLGDDTGENISRLNLYINELTALYWVWKNISNTVVGLAHYRRFFTESNSGKFSYEKILTKEAALKILESYDIIVSETYHGGLTQREFVANDCSKELATFGELILKKHLLQAQPDYLDAFEFVMNSTSLYKCNMFVTRKNIFEAYCKWLFSFLIDATEEAVQKADLENRSWSPRRLMSFLGERMLTVWLMKNRLRIKELKIMQVDGL